MGVAGKLATLGRLPLNGASNVVKAGAGAAGNLLNRTSRLFDTLGKRINRTAGNIISGGRRNKTKKNKKSKNKSKKNRKNKH